jgi:hypothetical protein
VFAAAKLGKGPNEFPFTKTGVKDTGLYFGDVGYYKVNQAKDYVIRNLIDNSNAFSLGLVIGTTKPDIRISKYAYVMQVLYKNKAGEIQQPFYDYCLVDYDNLTLNANLESHDKTNILYNIINDTIWKDKWKLLSL